MFEIDKWLKFRNLPNKQTKMQCIFSSPFTPVIWFLLSRRSNNIEKKREFICKENNTLKVLTVQGCQSLKAVSMVQWWWGMKGIKYMGCFFILSFCSLESSSECGVPDNGCLYPPPPHWNTSNGDRIQQEAALWRSGTFQKGKMY